MSTAPAITAAAVSAVRAVSPPHRVVAQQRREPDRFCRDSPRRRARYVGSVGTDERYQPQHLPAHPAFAVDKTIVTLHRQPVHTKPGAPDHPAATDDNLLRLEFSRPSDLDQPVHAQSHRGSERRAGRDRVREVPLHRLGQMRDLLRLEHAVGRRHRIPQCIEVGNAIFHWFFRIVQALHQVT